MSIFCLLNVIDELKRACEVIIAKKKCVDMKKRSLVLESVCIDIVL